MFWPFNSIRRSTTKRSRTEAPVKRLSFGYRPKFELLEDRRLLSGLGTFTPPISLVSTPITGSNVTLGQSSQPMLDNAVLSGGNHPTGTLTFMLYEGATKVYTVTQNVLGDGSYTTPNGYMLPTSGQVAGTYNWYVSYSGDHNNAAVSRSVGEQVIVNPAKPTLTTTALPNSAMVGSSTVLKDTAALTVGYHETSSLTFTLWLGNTKLDTETRTVNGNGLYTTPTGYTLPNNATPGTYQWQVTYSGDCNNSSVTSILGSEPVFVSGKSTPIISTTQQPASTTVGSSIADKATVTGGNNPTGTVTFNLYNNPSGTGPSLYTVTQTLSGGTATSGSYVPTATGTVYWVATYNGNTNNYSVASATCAEPVTIAKATPSISTTQQPASITVGSSIADKVTVSGGYNPTGTVTFKLYNNPSGTGPSLYTVTETLSGGTATSGSYVPSATGTDYWVATYNGNGNNYSVASATSAEPVTIAKATPSITTSQQPASTTVGSSIADKVTVTGGFNPTGTVTFNLYNNPSGTGTPAFTDTEPLSGGTATSASFTTTGTGTGYWVATYNGNGNNNSVTSVTSAEPVTVTPATPSISTTQQPATVTVGGTIADQVTVTGGYNPTGTVTFNLYNNPNGTGTPAFTDTEPLSGGTATSASFTTTGTGTGYWVATYNGNGNNNSVTSVTSAEPVTVAPATPSISTTQQPATVTVGGTIADQVTVTGGYNPTGTVTFNLYANPSGTGTPAFTDTETLVGGTATSASFTTTGTGTGYWVATYNGDGNNDSVTSVTSAEPVTVTPATPMISTTQQPATVTVGGTIADQVTVSGGYNPTGTVTFNLYATPNGTGPLIFTDTESLSGGTATSASFTTAGTGTGYWVATYNGDGNNNSVTSVTSAEPVTVTPATPMISTTQQPASVTVGATIADQVFITGGYNPSGTVTFNLYANPNGTGTPAFTDTEPLSGGTATSNSFTTTGPGTGYWVATYNGDENNNSVTSVTSAEPVTVTLATPMISTIPMPATTTVGSSIADAVTLSGGNNPTGTLQFNLYNNPNGAGTPVFSGIGSISSGGLESIPLFTTTAAGTFYWVVTYEGDSNNNSVTSGTSDEPVTVIPASPTLTTSASETAGGVVGTSVLSDSATLSGSYMGTGTITFTLTAPDNSVTTYPAVTVSGDNTYTSPNVTATQVGTYTWHATYSGDSNNNGATDNSTNEGLTTVVATPSILTIAHPTSATVGQIITDQVIVYGGDNPTGTVTFKLYTNSIGAGAPLVTDSGVTLSGGTATSPGYSPNAESIFYWVVTYNGDSHNGIVTSGDADEPITVTGP